MDYTRKEALDYAAKGKIEDWLHSYFQNEGDNRPLSDGLKKARRHYSVPVDVPLSLLKRCCGPEEDMPYQVSAESFEFSVNNIINRIHTGWDMPPFFVEVKNKQLILSDGNHRIEALRRMGRKNYSVIFWCTGEMDHLAMQELVKSL